MGESPSTYPPQITNGTCQAAQMRPLVTSGAGIPESTRRVTMKPRQPISSPGTTRRFATAETRMSATTWPTGCTSGCTRSRSSASA